MRKLASITVFLIVIALQGIGTWFLHKALSEQSDTTCVLWVLKGPPRRLTGGPPLSHAR